MVHLEDTAQGIRHEWQDQYYLRTGPINVRFGPFLSHVCLKALTWDQPVPVVMFTFSRRVILPTKAAAFL